MKSATRTRCQQIFAAFAVLTAGTAAADTYIVDRFDDSTIDTCSILFNDCALRGAIIKANAHPGDDIVDLGTGTYTLSIGGTYEDLCQTGDLDVTDELLIVGEGPERTTIDADGIDRVLQVIAPSSGLTLRGVTIRGGNPAGQAPHHDGGAGIRISSGYLHVDTCFILDNHSLTGNGGGISDYNSIAASGLTIVDSWIADNSAYNCSAVYIASNFQLERSTVSSNVATADDALCIHDSGATLINSTISNNGGADIGGVFIFAPSVRLNNCTLVNNQGRDLFAPYDSPTLANTLISGSCGGVAVTSLGGNLESPGNTCGLGAIDLANVADPMVTGLLWVGGPTPVHRPRTGSPALDEPLAGIVFPGVDQRSLSRPRDGAGPPFAISDIGAVELAGDGEIFVETFECGFLTAWSISQP